MVGWLPWDLSVRKKTAAIFSARAKESQRFGLLDTPLLLHYDCRHADMRAWLWPAENGVPVRPDQLDGYRYTHYFKGPCCPLLLERYFSHPSLMTGKYPKRDIPLKVTNPFLFLTDDTEETIKKAGLRQMHILRDKSNTGLRGTNKLLRREDPEHFLKLQESLRNLLAKGLPADDFWDLFVQCTNCRYVMPAQYFPYYHACIVQLVHPQMGLPRALPEAPKLPELLPSELDGPIDEASLPGPATSDDEPSWEGILKNVSRMRANQAAPATPKARR
ncbi:hypothetical protein NMY22_g7154 [Coprinellus aureogranulatus]|nr:hypothetical protein NMY22_g7154 [Coprinellus aureogranulatus]